MEVLTAEAAADPTSLLLAYGPLGIFAALLIWYAKTSIAREQLRTERAEQQVKELNEFIRKELLPKQIEGNLLSQQVAEVLGQAVEIIAEMKYVERSERRRG